MSVRPEFAGRAGKCPNCAGPFVTPPQSTADPNAPQQPAAAPPPPQPQLPPAPQPVGYGQPGGGYASPPAPAHSGQGAARLEVVHGPNGFQGQSFPLDPRRPIVLGRDPAADLRIPSERVSRRHCQVQAAGHGYVLVDLGSSNGTLVNQTRINGSRQLQPGDYIQAGDCLFRYSV